MTLSNQRPLRILQVVGGMNRGGIETWLINVLRHIDRDRFQIDFLVHTTQPCAYDNEIRALG
ncbi:glycosyltransferase, partial [Chroococcidiopsis cubana CCALA 043]